MKIEVFNMTALAVILLATTVVVKSESWSWAKGEDTKTDQAETAERRSDEDKDKKTGEEPTPAAAGEGRHLFNYGADEIFSADNETDVENVVDTILFSSRQGRNLEGYDEVYTDPSVQEALQKGDDVQARNLIKQKLCNLGLMSCGPDEVIGKRPFRPPPPPGFYSHGPPKGPYGPPKGPYGPPRPMPPPPPNGKFGPPRKVGYEGFPVSKPYPSKPFGPYGLNEGETFERPPPGATIIYDSKPPPEAVIAGADAPYRFEGAASKIHVAQNHNSFHHSSHAQGSLLHTKPLGPIGPIAPQIDALNPVASATTLQQHVHHHYHHVEGGAGGVGKAPNVIINNPVPVPLSTGNSLTSEFSSLTASSGGFSPVAGVGGIGSNHISPSNTNSGYGLLSQGTYGGLSQSGFNGVNSGANGLYGSGIKPVKEYENADGPFGGYGSGANGGNYASGVNGGNYASGVNGGNYASGINGGNYASGVNGGAYTPGSPGGGFSAGFGGATGGFGASSNFNGNSQSFHSTNPNYYKKELENGGSAFSELNSFGQQNKYSSQFNGQYSQFGNGDSDAYQGFETARQQNIDCVCVPYQQCPAQDRIGRKDDLILPLDPRNLGKNIEALTDEAVITDGNGTMITVRVPKDTSSVANETKSENEPKKVVKREAAAQKQDNLQDPANNVEGRNGEDRYTAIGLSRRKVLPTFGVSFGLPFPTGAYPINAFNQYPAVNQHFGSISPNGLNLGLLNVNPLLSLQVTKNEFGEKLVKPLVNLHVTPNEQLIHKVGSLFKAKKQHLVNQHYHHHTHYPSHSPSGPYGYPEEQYHGPEFYPSPGPHYGSGGFGYPSTYPGSFGGPPGEIDFPPFGGYNPYSRSANEGNQSFYSGSQDRLRTNPNVYADNFDYSQQQKLQSFQSSANAIRQTPTQAPGAAPGGRSITFPNSRRRRSVDDDVETISDTKAKSRVNEQVNSHTSNLEKRQAFYGGGIPQQCGPQHVCCRRPHRPQQQQQLGRCGTRNAHGITGRIKNPVYVDGDSEFGEYPWQAAILKKDPKESIYVCGGTIIDAQHIITAAHCVKTYAGFDLRVRLGEWDVNHDVEFFPYIERDVISVHIHPEYYAGTLDNDLAVLKLNHPIDFTKSPHISPACLPDKFSDFTGARCWTTGWGKDAFGEFGKYQNILKEVDVPIIHPQQCQEQLRHTRLGFNYNLHPGFICAGGEEGKDACKGDGGGPLVCDRNGIWHVVGVVSWGIGCGQVNVPGVYVRVAHYLDWINSITRNY